MIGVILTGHAGFADGVASAVKLIGGEQEKFAVVNFLEEDSGESLAGKLRQAVEELGCQEVVFREALLSISLYCYPPSCLRSAVFLLELIYHFC